MSATIPIAIDSPGGSVPKGRRQASLSRRQFLQGTAVLTGTLAIGSPLALVAPSRSWAATMSALNDDQARALLRLTQVIFPHEAMPEAINAIAVKDIDGAVAGSPEVLSTLEDGLAALDEQAGGRWIEASDADQLAAVEASTDTALFSLVRGQCITSLYDNELAYQHFGYEGEAFSKGGYLTRGFDDLAWLPDPPADASPAAL